MERKPTTRKTTRKPSTTTGNELRPAIGYVRVSTMEQATEGNSLRDQRERIEAFCKAHNYALIHIHADEGLSGTRADNRPGLQAALAAVCKSGGVLVATKLDRVTRSVLDAGEISRRVEGCGGGLALMDLGVDTTTAAGKAFFNIAATFAQMYRDTISENTRRNLQNKRQHGERVGTVPFGYRVGDDGKHLIADPTEQAAIRRMRDLRERGNGGKGMGYAAIARVLNGEMVKPRGKAWHAQGVSLILNRESEPVPAASAA